MKHFCDPGLSIFFGGGGTFLFACICVSLLFPCDCVYKPHVSGKDFIEFIGSQGLASRVAQVRRVIFILQKMMKRRPGQLEKRCWLDDLWDRGERGTG